MFFSATMVWGTPAQTTTASGLVERMRVSCGVRSRFACTGKDSAATNSKPFFLALSFKTCIAPVP